MQEESGLNPEALDVYQQCLGELLLVLAGRERLALLKAPGLLHVPLSQLPCPCSQKCCRGLQKDLDRD